MRPWFIKFFHFQECNKFTEGINKSFFAIIKVRNSCCVCKITLLKTFYKVHASRKTLTW